LSLLFSRPPPPSPSLPEEFLQQLERSNMTKKKIDLAMPSFKLESNIQLTENLKQLGQNQDFIPVQ
jgi:hypothetical protein